MGVEDGVPTPWKPSREFVLYNRPRAELSQRHDLFTRALDDPRPNAVAFPIGAKATHAYGSGWHASTGSLQLPPLKASMSTRAPLGGVFPALLDTWTSKMGGLPNGKTQLRSTFTAGCTPTGHAALDATRSTLTASGTTLRTPTGTRRDTFITERLGRNDYAFRRVKADKSSSVTLHPAIDTICDDDTVDEVITKLNRTFPDHFPTATSFGTAHLSKPPLQPRRAHTLLACKGKVLDEGECIGPQCMRLYFRPPTLPNVERCARLDIATRARRDVRPPSIAYLPLDAAWGQHCEM
uniref:Uncharacterized protein n=1 Tax=Haptolina ericina TaxID=156174 RepID=A0A7S3EU69_9EUKA|mmetsp:Transcript_23863/g.54321  ORF Transcript_23863/g.54321 Transcript_23863/m.54321 type:complete len:295 (+) Transcript_23863:12-896(+)